MFYFIAGWLTRKGTISDSNTAHWVATDPFLHLYWAAGWEGGMVGEKGGITHWHDPWLSKRVIWIWRQQYSPWQMTKRIYFQPFFFVGSYLGPWMAVGGDFAKQICVKFSTIIDWACSSIILHTATCTDEWIFCVLNHYFYLFCIHTEPPLAQAFNIILEIVLVRAFLTDIPLKLSKPIHRTKGAGKSL